MPRNNALALQDLILARYAIHQFKGAKYEAWMCPYYPFDKDGVRAARFERYYNKILWGEKV